MNRIKSHIVLILLSLLYVSCADTFFDDGEFKPSLSPHFLRPSKTTFSTSSYKEYSEEFYVTSSHTSWTFTSLPEWLSLTPESSDTTSSVLMFAQENKSADANRTALFYLESTHPDWKYSRGLSFSQGKATYSLSADKSDITFSGAASSGIIMVTANCTWSVSNSESWITTECDIEQGILKISVSSNESSKYRTGTIYIKYGSYYNSYSFPITVKQSPAGIISSISRLEFENIASSYTIKIESEAAWKAIASDSWINISPNKGNSGTTEVYVEVTPNTSVSQRIGYISFYIGDKIKLQIEIIQVGLYIYSVPDLGFSASVEKKELQIESNTDWEILTAPNWLSFSKTKGTGDDVVEVSATENPNTTCRNGEIILGQPGLDIDFVISVTQYKKYLYTNENVIEFSDKACIDSFKVYSNSSWTSQCSDSWFKTTPQNGFGDNSIIVSVLENKTDTERVGTLEYYFADNSANVNIHQLAKYLTIDDKVFEFSSIGGSNIIDISSNDKWTAEIEHNVSWMSLSSTSGTGDSQITIKAEDNPTINVRSTALVIKSEHAQCFRILVSQQAKTLSVSTNNILFFSKGGFSDIIRINTEGKYNITCDATWLSINKEEGNAFKVYASRNNESEFRYASIIVTLTDLVDCSLSLEIPVTQAGNGASFIIDGFKDDNNWNIYNDGDYNLSVTGYSSDKDWNKQAGTLVITTSGYSTEYDWNRNDKSNGRVSIVNYSEDADWNNSNNSIQITTSNFSTDNNWN